MRLLIINQKEMSKYPEQNVKNFSDFIVNQKYLRITKVAKGEVAYNYEQ